MKKLKEGKITQLRKKALKYSNKEKWNESVRILKKILQIEPNNLEALCNCGAILSNIGRYKESLKYLNRVLEIDPNDWGALVNKGNTLSKLKKPKLKEALKCFDKSLTKKALQKITPKIRDELVKISYHDKGMVLESKSNFSGAIKFFKKAYKIDSKDIDLLNHLAFNSFNTKKYTETIKFADALLRLNSNDIDAMIFKVKSLIKTKKRSQTIELLNKLIRIDKKNRVYYKKMKKII